MLLSMPHSIARHALFSIALTSAFALLSACEEAAQPVLGDASDAAQPEAANDDPAPQQPAGKFATLDEPALEVVWLAGEAPGGSVYNGSMPKTEAAFDALASLGVRTIISVDGAAPNVDAATTRGMRYVHLPLGYDAVEAEDRLQLAAAIRDLPGPFYIHCHHGKHRSPAAVAAAMCTLGAISNEEGHAMLTFAGTSESYPGLWRDVAASTPAEAADLDAVDLAALPSHAQISDFAQAMVAMDHTFENLKHLARNDWRVPDDHPDLVPASEAAQMTELFRALESIDHEEAQEMRALLPTSLVASNQLEQALAEGRQDAATAAFIELRNACKACHEQHRNE